MPDVTRRVRGRTVAAVARYEQTVVVRVLRRMKAVDGYDRALALSAQAFVALVPLVVLVSALLPAGARESGPTVAARLGLSESAASAVSVLIREPPGVEAITVVGGVLLVMAALGFTRALQRTYVSAWDLPRTGIRGLGHGLAAAAFLTIGLGALALVGPTLAVLDGHVLVELTVHAVAASLLWWPVQRVLLGGRVSWRALMPSAALTGVGQAIVVSASSVLLPIALARQAARYGLLGVAVALLSWLVAVGLLLVLSAVVGAELARRPRTPASPPPAVVARRD